ncbi:MAG: hypothetical protein RI993_2047 [Pseudomonadota bacterium]
MNNSATLLFIFFLVALITGCQSVVEHGPRANSAIHFLVQDRSALFSSGNFDNKKTVYVKTPTFKSVHLPLLATLMKEYGFNVTSDKDNADYLISITAFITMPFKKNGGAMPYTAEYLLSISEELPVIKPLLIPGEPAKKQMDKMAKLVNRATNNGANFDMGPNPISLGSTFGGSLGGIIAGATVGVISTAIGTASQNNIREGLAGFNFKIFSYSASGSGIGFNIYSASTRPEHPETLLRAAIEYAANEMGVRK